MHLLFDILFYSRLKLCSIITFYSGSERVIQCLYNDRSRLSRLYAYNPCLVLSASLRLHVLCLASNAARVSESFTLDCLLCFSNIYLSVGFAADPQLLKVFFVYLRATLLCCIDRFVHIKANK
jgi:hypothetical protein